MQSICLIIRKRRWFFTVVATFWVVSFVVYLVSARGDEILFFAHHRSSWADQLFIWGTKLGEPLGYLLVAAFLAFRHFRALVSLPLAAIVVAILSVSLKWLFGHERPLPWFQKMHPDEVIPLVEGVNVFTGATSFPSGHTMSAFVLFTLAALWSGSGRFQQGLCAFLAILVGLSRIYLVQHFLEDVLAGSVLGVCCGLFVWLLIKDWQRPAWLNYRLGVIKMTC